MAMKKLPRIIPLFFLFLFLGAGIAGEAGDLQIVETQGSGKTAMEAELDALRQAVVQVSGAMVDMETLIENDDVVKDTILSHSAGIVEKMERIGNPTGNVLNGFTVTIRATVRKTALMERLKNPQIISKKVDGASLLATSATTSQTRMSGAQMLEKALEGLPENLLVARLVDQKIEKEGSNTTVRFVIEVFLHQEAYYTKVVPRLLDVLNVIAIRKTDGTMATTGEFIDYNKAYRHRARPNLSVDKKKELMVVVNVGRNQNLTSLRWEGFILPIDPYASVLNTVRIQAPNLRIACLDAENRVINEREVSPNRISGDGISFHYYPFFPVGNTNDGISYAFYPLVLSDIWNPFDVGVKDSFTFHTDMEFSLEELGRMNDIKLYFVPNTVNR